ncbi:hypothetical protein [Streptomyces sp. NRRL F-5630]|uniref:hypothetical protein n=1 Tax=Streptomyces sp. NRRL F-5630 TaxID=1463864 RepID=UPI003D71FBFD
MTPRQAAWVRARAWSPAARAEHEDRHGVLLRPTGCEMHFVSAVCAEPCASEAGDPHSHCSGGQAHLAETALLGHSGRRLGWVWPTHPCRVRCTCPCHTPAGVQHALDDLT